MNQTYIRIAAIMVIGLIAPLWSTWIIAKLIYGFFLLGGVPEHPSTIFMQSSVLLPSTILGLAVGTVIVFLGPRPLLMGWALFWVAHFVASFLNWLVLWQSVSVAELLTDKGNLAFLLGSLVVPLFISVRYQERKRHSC